MLAATSERFGNLEPIRIWLSLVRTNADQVPVALIEHAQAIIRQAKLLYADPNSVDKQTLPEAINLALAMRTHSELAADLGSIESVNQINAGMAARALDHLNAAFAD